MQPSETLKSLNRRKKMPGSGRLPTMSHMAITEMLDGKYVAWMEKVAENSA
jgi:hypothetical protein